MSELLRLPPGQVDLRTVPTDATPGFEGTKRDARLALADLGGDLADLQRRLFASHASGAARSVLLVLQGMDTSGKGGVLKHTVGLVDPQGVRIASFGPPTEEERSHDFLWRVRRALPAPGYIGVFDRSHYEDVLAARVRGLAEPTEVERRYGAINDFEAGLAAGGTVVLKCFLHISPATQRARLLARLDRPEKQWKFDPADIDDRRLWPQYRAAYEAALARTNTEAAPWFVVPADRKWYRNLAVGRLLLAALRGIDPAWPEPRYDVEHERSRLLGEDPLS